MLLHGGPGMWSQSSVFRSDPASYAGTYRVSTFRPVGSFSMSTP